MADIVTSAVVGRLGLEGELAVTDADLQPQWRDDDRCGVSAENLLRMSSGLAYDETHGLGTPVAEMLHASCWCRRRPARRRRPAGARESLSAHLDSPPPAARVAQGGAR